MIKRLASSRGHFAAALRAAMDELDLSIPELSKQLGVSCKHARRLCAGEALPSELLLEKTAIAAGIPAHELQLAVQRDRMRKGFCSQRTSSASKRIDIFEPVINSLDPEQVPAAYAMLDRLVKTAKSRQPLAKPTAVRTRKQAPEQMPPARKQRKKGAASSVPRHTQP